MTLEQQHRQERLIKHIAAMQERFDQGMLAELCQLLNSPAYFLRE